MPFGIIGTRYIETLPGIDEAYLRRLQTRSGLELTDLFGEFDAAMAAINAGVDPLVSKLVFPTTSEVARRRRTSRKYVQQGGEFTIARSQVGEAAGHMLPIGKNEITLGWTEDGIHDTPMVDIREELDDIVRSFGMLYRGSVLERLFSPAEVSVGRGTTVLSPGFAGSGTGSNVFTGIYPTGQPLPPGYTHYYVTDAAGLMTSIIAQRDQLKRWHRGPYDLIPSAEALAAIRGLDDVATYGADAFVAAGSALITRGIGERGANVNESEYVGVVAGNVRVMDAVDEIGDTNHFAIVKTYGDFATDNPLAWRYDDRWGRDCFTRTRDPFPLADAVALQWFGIGTYDRVGATLTFVDEVATEYEAPEIIF